MSQVFKLPLQSTFFLPKLRFSISQKTCPQLETFKLSLYEIIHFSSLINFFPVYFIPHIYIFLFQIASLRFRLKLDIIKKKSFSKLTVQSIKDSLSYLSHRLFAFWSMHLSVSSRMVLILPNSLDSNIARWNLLHQQRAQSVMQWWLPMQYQILLVSSLYMLVWHSQLRIPECLRKKNRIKDENWLKF